jgi:signal-transduction protein with cAMP-binding, CBS, and nucleotidyltransferase domain
MASFIRVSDLMVQNPVTAESDAPLIKVAQLRRDNSISSVILAEDNKPYGIMRAMMYEGGYPSAAFRSIYERRVLWA